MEYGMIPRANLSDDELCTLYNPGKINEVAYFGRTAVANEYFIAVDKTGFLVDIFRKHSDGRWKVINDQAKGKTSFLGMGAREGNYEQICVLDALISPDIDVLLVDGKAGTGKTFISLLGAFHTLLKTKCGYKNILYTREIAEVGEKMGYLPGDVSEKTNPYWEPARQGVRKIFGMNKKFAEYNPEEKKDLILTPLQFLRGTTWDNVIMINDEVQNEKLQVAQTFISRAGENSKVILMGSTHQIDNEALLYGNDALTLIRRIYQGQDNFATITLTKWERSRVAQQVDDLVEKFRKENLNAKTVH